MNVKQSFKLALKSILSSKFRSFLTMLGIIIGVAAVIVLVSLVNGFANDMAESFESLGTNLLTVNIRGRGGNVKVTPIEVMEFAEEKADVISAVSPTVTISSATVKYESDNLTTSVYGVSEDYYKIKSYNVENGRFVEFVDCDKRLTVCVLGKYIANELFPMGNCVGKKIKINGEQYSIVGVIEAKQEAKEGSIDDMVIIPYTTASRLSRNSSVSAYSFSAKDKDKVDFAKAEIEKYLFGIFNNSDYYNIYSQSESLEQINELSSTLTTVLVGVAAISLLVGGIGIMNIMLVSVTERTREIGIRKALGGKRRDILLQFVIEAATTSALGGVLGIFVGIGAAILAGNVLDLSADISLNAITIAFSVSVGIGIIFGYFPAAKASKLNPIDALRYD